MALHDPETTPEKDGDSKRLEKVHTRALRRFDSVATPQAEIRAHALLCRRFISIPGAMWEGPWGDQFENSIKVEIDKLSKGVDKIVQDYRANRIVPDFRPSGGNSDQDTADTLDGLHRADSYYFKSQQARDNAFEEAAAGGFGAYRLTNEYADPSDKDNDEQRINPALTIVDADQRVFFDGNSKLYDKSDAKWAIVLTADSREAFEEEHPGKAVDWPDVKTRPTYDWFAPDVVVRAEYYEVETKPEKLLVFTQLLTEETESWWESDLEPKEIAELKARGWRMETKSRERKRVHKYTMTGAEVLKDNGYIAGENIPIVPVYGKRWFVDNQERFRGHVSKLMDAQRIYNAKVSKLSETDSLAPREKPIFLAEQMPPSLQDLWARQEQERHPYALVNPVIDPVTGEIKAMGPIGKIEPPQLQPVTAALLQIAAGDLQAETDDGSDEVKANTSVDAMDFAATRIDAKSGIYLDNMAQSVQREGENYLSMAKECYFEPGRTVETMTEDGDDGEATLHESFTDRNGVHRVRNNFSSGRYKVIADVTEATATRRDKTVRSALATAEIAMQAGDTDLAQAAIITAITNQDGEGMSDLQKYARKKGVAMGLIEPNEEEKAEMAQQQQQPDPTQELAAAKAADLGASAQLKDAKAEEAKASTMLKVAQASTLGGPEEAPAVPDGLEAAHKVADIAKKTAEAEHIRTQTAHLPEQLAVERANAGTNRIKAMADRAKKLFTGG
jgi:hypothetical protein